MPFTLNDFYKVEANDACTQYDGYKLMRHDRVTITIRTCGPDDDRRILGMENLATGSWHARVCESLEEAVATACEVYAQCGWGE